MYLFPYEKVKLGSQVMLFGAGTICEDYIRQIEQNKYCRIKYIIANFQGTNSELFDKYNIVLPTVELFKTEIDYIILTAIDLNTQKEMISDLEKNHAPLNKLVFPSQKIYFRENSYSQHGEDRIIYTAFQHMGFFRDSNLPSYLDVGAHDPYEISNTALFHQLGCKGINIEANPKLLDKFKKERPHDINICIGVGPKKGIFPFYITGFDGLNTFRCNNLKHNEELIKIDKGIEEKISIKSTINIPVDRLDNIIAEYNKGIWPEFMSMDIEGLEYETLKDLDLSNGPLLIDVEVNFDGDLFISLMKNKGYFPYLWFRENIIFVKNEMERLVHYHEIRK